MKNYRQLIHEDIRNLGIADNFLGEECLYLALDILKDAFMLYIKIYVFRHGRRHGYNNHMYRKKFKNFYR